MSEHLFEYIAIIILLILFCLFLLRHEIREYFSPPRVQIRQASLGIKVKNGYLNLLKLLYHNSNKEALEKEIRYISTTRTDDRYIGGYTKDTYEFDDDSFILDYFYEILNYTDSQEEEFIFTVTDTSNLEELDNKLEKLFGDSVKNVDKNSKNIKERLLSYKETLAKKQIEMTFLSDGSDSYYFIFYPRSNKKEVLEAIEQIGLEELILTP